MLEPMDGIYTLRFPVPPTAIDANDHVNNIAYLQWMQDVAIGHTVAMGWPPGRYFELGAAWVARSHFIEYLRPAFLGDAVALHTWIESMNRRRCPRHYAFLRERDGVLLARAKTEWVYVDLKTGRPATIPGEMVQAFPVVAMEDAEAALGIARHTPMRE